MHNEPAKPTVTPVRLPADLRAWLKHRAIDNRRTLGNEVIFLLEQCRQADDQKGPKQ